MIAGDFRRDEDYGEGGGLELRLGLAIGGRSRYAERPAGSAGEQAGYGGSVEAQAPTALGRTVSGPPDAVELQRRREMHAMKRQEARRKLEVKQQIRKGGGGGSGNMVARGKSSSSGGGALWRNCSADERVVLEAQEQRVRERDREAREGEDGQRQRKVGVIGDGRSPPAGGCGTPPATAGKSRSGSTTPTEIPAENNNNNTHHPCSSTAPSHTPGNVTPPYHFPPIMPMPYPLLPAQYVHFGAAGFPYLLPCWTPPPQVAPAPAQPGPGGEPNRGLPVPPAWASSFRPFRQASGNLGGVMPQGVADVNNSAKTPVSAGGMQRVSSLSASQGSSFSAISEYQSDPDPLQGVGGASSGGDNTQANSSPDHHPAASVDTPGWPSSSRSSPPRARTDHSVSSHPTTANDDTPPPDAPASRSASAGNDRSSPRAARTPVATPAPPPPPPRPVPPSTTGAAAAASTRPPPIRPRTMPYVSAKGTGPNGRTITGFLYKFDDKDKVSIVCVCHGTAFTPAEFVRHAGATDVDNPLRHIVMVEEPPQQRVMVPSA